MKALIENLKDNNQDFEFYPTTKEIIEVIYNDLGGKDRYDQIYSLLDVGCGNGNFFKKFKEIREEIKQYHLSIGLEKDEDYMYCENSENLRKKMKPKASISGKFAIEKSEVLISSLERDIVVLGTDFWQNTLIDKKVDVIFSNPPYSEFEEWSAKIINEAYCKYIYLVIPERWKKSDKIKSSLAIRNLEANVLGDFDFLDAERAARAKVNIVKISPKKLENRFGYYETEIKDPFDSWFETEFKINLKKDVYESWSQQKEREEKSKKERIENEIVAGRDLVQALVVLYQQDMNHLLESYKKIAELDGELLEELGVKLDGIKNGLKEKIKGLKYKYWHEFFNNFDNIKSRLTYSKRETLLNKLHESTSIDFTESNIYAIVIWVIKNANKYFDEQLKEVYLRITETECVQKYKSNQRTWDQDKWRYRTEGTNSHYALDYRVITYAGYNNSSFGKDYQSELINDVEVIANNLGFNYIGDIKTFKNGNVHFRFEKDFIKAFNIEAARLFGWIKSAEEAVKEFPESYKLTPEEASKYFSKNYEIVSSPKQLLLN